MKTLFYFLSLLLISANTYAGIISGSVTNATNNAPVSNAQIMAVKFDNPSGDSVIFTAQSGPGGLFTLNIPVIGNYKLIASHPEFHPVTQGPVIIDPNTTAFFTFALQPRNTTAVNLIAGIVKNSATNLPVTGAKVSLLGSNSVGATMFTYTDAAGKFRFQNIIPGTYGLNVQKEGFVNYLHPQHLTITQTTIIENLLISLIPGGTTLTASVSGGVYQATPNPTWSPITGAEITFSSANGVAFTTVSDTFGRYTINSIPAGVYMVKCSKAGFVSKSVPNFNAYPDTMNSLDFYLEPVLNSNFIKGKAKNGMNQAPIIGAEVHLAPNNMLPVIFTAVTGNDGRYAFFELPPGSYRMSANKDGFYPYVRNELIEVTTATQIENLDFLMAPVDPTLTGTVSGKVTTSSSAGTAIPVAGAKVMLMGADSAMFFAFTNNTGEYVIDNVIPGIYSAVCSKEGYQNVTRFPYNVIPGANFLPFFLVPQGGNTFGVISGVVTIDGQNLPVPNALIQFFSNNAPAVAPFSTRTGANGTYHKELPSGTYFVSVTIESPDSNGFYREYYDNVPDLTQAAPVQISGGANVGNINFGVPAAPSSGFTFTVSGIVRNTNNMPVAGANVKIISPISAVPPTPAFNAVTNEQGEYTMAVTFTAPVNQYVFYIAASKEGYATQFWDHKTALHLADLLTVHNGSNLSDINFDLSSGGTIGTYSVSGAVTNSAGSPLAGTFVLTTKALSAGQIIISVTDSAGHYSTQLLPPGKYYNLFLKEGYIPEYYNDALRWENATAIVIGNANVTAIDAALAPVVTTSAQGIFAGFVRDETGAPISGALINVSAGGGAIRNYAMSDATGYYSIDGISALTYDITATQVGYVTAMQTVSYNPQNGTMHAVDFILPVSPVLGSDEGSEIIPAKFALSNYPNPFNPETIIKYEIPEGSAQQVSNRVILRVFDMLGTEVAILVDEEKPAGDYKVTFNASGLPSGIYFCELRHGETRIVRKMTLMK